MEPYDGTRRYITTGEAAKRLCIAPATVGRLFDEGYLRGFRIPSRRPGRQGDRRIEAASVEDLARRNEIGRLTYENQG